MKLSRALLAVVLVLAVAAPGLAQDHPDIRLFFQAGFLGNVDENAQKDALKEIEKNWHPSYAIMLAEMARFLPDGKGNQGAGIEASQAVDPEAGGGDIGREDPLAGGSRFASRRNPKVQARERIMGFLKDRTDQDFGEDFQAWREWSWEQDYDPHPQLGVFLANFYGILDPTFRNYFQGPSSIRLDEVQWGGVTADGIPPLDHPKMISAGDASYLDDSNIIFGFYEDGQARAYPKRILAWHELMYDKVGETEMTVVYCTLCGTVIPYRSTVGGREVRFGTSGMLYRSNKLFYDGITYTLWSSLTGEPVAGRAVGSGMRMEHLPVVTTTWGEWKSMHPDTQVLSLDTGFERDYGEGVAYQAYFATDELMFNVPETNSRLKNKDEVLALRVAREGEDDVALAIAADFLRSNPVHMFEMDGRNMVVLTSANGANRVYDAGGTDFARMIDANTVEDSGGTAWTVSEDELKRQDGSGAPLARVPAFRAFWFGWYAQYPDTELITN
jgi:hypothetical protein